ncbi:MAG: Asp-tRNA(Asn)/Glu-tRNA(Gln) amidotransferase subunit GatA [Pseudomonadales bacterium]
MHNKSIVEILDDLKQGRYSSKELTLHYLERIEQLDSRFNAYITQLSTSALEAAEQADEGKRPGLLSGVPIAHKDIFCTEGVRTSAGSRMLDNFIAPYSATVVENLAAAGAITLGKTNMDEFAMGSSNETSFYKNVRNPWDVDRVPGGSSGGSAAAVAAGLCSAATGTDTGGSIRQPASMCGITGLKPTYGRVSRWGMIAFASSLDQAGPMTKTAEDAALMLAAMSGADPRDSTSLDEPVPDYRSGLNEPLDGLRVGLCKEYFEEGLDTQVETVIMEAVQVLESLGATISEQSLSHTRYSVPAYYVIAPAECSANLARYDGVRFGHRCDAPRDIEDLYKRSRDEGFGREVKRRIMVGSFALSAGYYDAYYKKAQQVRRLIKNDFVEAFREVDVLVGPVSPSTAFKIGEKSDDQISMYLQDIYTIASNLAGLPALSIPAGFSNDLPVGLQLIGNYLGEQTILRVAHQFQQHTDWHRTFPSIAEE